MASTVLKVAGLFTSTNVLRQLLDSYVIFFIPSLLSMDVSKNKDDVSITRQNCDQVTLTVCFTEASVCIVHEV